MVSVSKDSKQPIQWFGLRVSHEAYSQMLGEDAVIKRFDWS